MKLKFIQSIAVAFSVFTAGTGLAQASSWSDFHVVERVQMDNVNTIYVRPAGLIKWGGNSSACPNATYVTIKKSDNAFYNEMLTLVLTSKLNQMQVKFRGICDSSGNYLNANYMYIR